MYSRLLQPPGRSFFLFGPRGTGKTAWLRAALPDAITFDLLHSGTHQRLSAAPERLGDAIPDGYRGWIVVDEIQRVPELLNEVHRLIETRKLRFAMTGSSARKLRRGGVNLLAGRARTLRMHPLTAGELGADFDLERALRFGLLPFACTTDDPASYLADYVGTYLREEVQAEGLVRKLGAFSRFLESASFSQGSVLNVAAVARDAAVNSKAAETYFDLAEDLLLTVRLPVFARRAKRHLIAHPKFYFFDAGVYRALRPRGPLDSDAEIDGAALETIVLSHIRAVNDAFDLGYTIHYWRTRAGHEVDFVLYGERGLVAIEVKRSDRLRDEDLDGLREFREDYPMARTFLTSLVRRREHVKGIEVVPAGEFLRTLESCLRGEPRRTAPKSKRT